MLNLALHIVAPLESHPPIGEEWWSGAGVVLRAVTIFSKSIYCTIPFYKHDNLFGHGKLYLRASLFSSSLTLSTQETEYK